MEQPQAAYLLIEGSMSMSLMCFSSLCPRQLYNEEVNDLLAPENTKLPIHESKENGIYVCGLREDIVTSPEQVLITACSCSACSWK